MTLTLLALFLAPFYLKMVLDPKASHQAYKELSQSPGCQMALSMLLLLTSMLIFSQVGLRFEFEWYGLINWIALLIAVKGVAVLIPGFYREKLKMLTAERIPFFGFLGLVTVLLMVYVDTQLLA